MTRILVIIALLGSCLCCQTVQTPDALARKPSQNELEIRSTELYAALTKAYEERGFVGVTEVTYSIELETSQIGVVALWMRDTYLQPRKNPRFGWIYAETLQMMAKVLRERTSTTRPDIVD